MILTHLNWGITLIIAPEQVRIISSLIGISRLFSDLNFSTSTVGVVLIMAALGSAIGLALDWKQRKPTPWGFRFMFPQFMLNIGAALSDCYSIATGHLEGRDLNRIQLEAALCVTIIVAVFHTILVIQRYTDWTRPRIKLVRPTD